MLRGLILTQIQGAVGLALVCAQKPALGNALVAALVLAVAVRHAENHVEATAVVVVLDALADAIPDARRLAVVDVKRV